MLVVSAVAAVVMLAGALLLGGDEDDDRADDGRVGGDHDQYDHDALNVRAVLLDTTDVAAVTGVAATGAVIADGLYWLDPAVALVSAVVVAYHATRLLTRIRTSLRS